MPKLTKIKPHQGFNSAPISKQDLYLILPPKISQYFIEDPIYDNWEGKKINSS